MNRHQDKCPHGCARCRALEQGLIGPYTPAEFLELYELVEPPARNGWSPETLEARGAVDVAQIAYEQARANWLDTERALTKARPGSERAKALAEACVVARAECDEVGERLIEARVRHHQLTRVDGERHIVAELAASAAAQDQAIAERTRASRSAGRSTLERLLRSEED